MKVSDVDIVLIKSLGQKIKSRMFDFLVGLLLLSLLILKMAQYNQIRIDFSSDLIFLLNSRLNNIDIN